ncbi:septation ring formation regulator EzrA [Vagococcus carniphilus]|uniref:Septation ring formation regulator EzrA n=1 Tax=Vagococcus carniphilus TaxID=218144 RepID=A0AAW8UB63_9ENTE|nr:septation ring formation regulator EzrA [Vagococcus carniphilus]MDT2813800.1 septation ring formation regulator EzrA [Vagococcus carniphilus]MDT2832171.1 septation ring formation regulator EzrA [Vagococcus carniphilus]MDT2834939.1 septation ring formation regulator EzrA [Vagococcus carniphilus]MDT2838236.1 septation ring formation regulator EzrA [Vagococcus carniphilus]MDT2853604.1 septation ring formation regulator EzrA [Vagococcus carniphilus]
MNTKLWLWLLLIVVILAAATYLVAFFMRRKNQDRLEELEKRKIALFDLPVLEEVDSVKKMHLVGQSQNTFREWNQKWIDISTISFAELESLIFEIENLNETFRLMKVKDAIEEAELTLVNMESEVEEIRKGLSDLKESEVRNSEAVQEALDAYEAISESVTSDSDKYGVSYKELEKQIQNVERDFTQFVALNTAGDPMEARTVLEKAEKRTYEIQKVIDEVPPLFETLDKVFPKQLKEIKDGYESMKKDHYVFENDVVQTNVDKLDGKVRSTLMNLEKLEVENVGKLNSEIAKEIDQLYDVMQKEIEARHYVNENKTTLVNFLEHADKNNHLLLIELDTVSQSYVLNNNELGKVRGFQAQMEEMQKEFDAIEDKLKNKKAVFSQVAAFYRESLDQLKDIEEEQIETGQSIKDFAPRERDAIKKIDDYELELRTLKRHIEKQRLPGIPSSYLEFFFVAGERIEELSRELNKIRIDMNHIDRLVGLCEEDIATLNEKTNNLIDSAALTEQMIQYANRFRFSHPEIKNAIDRSLSLFSREHLYQDALDTISEAVERIEPGVTERIRKYYYDNKDNMI